MLPALAASWFTDCPINLHGQHKSVFSLQDTSFSKQRLEEKNSFLEFISIHTCFSWGVQTEFPTSVTFDSLE